MSETLRYACRLRPMGPETILTLHDGQLRAERTSGVVSALYGEIAAVRLTFMPRGGYLTGFRTRISLRDGRSVAFDDTTYGGFFAQRRQAAEYRAFVLGLLERVGAANPGARLIGGRGRLAQSATAIASVVFIAALPVMAWRAVAAGQWPLALLLIGAAAAFAALSFELVRRNRPRDLRDGVPDDLLPQDETA